MTRPLTDAELDRIMEAAWVLHPQPTRRLRANGGAEAAARRARPGTLHRIIAEAQHAYLRIGPIAIGSSRSKYGLPQAVRVKGK
jgi:hypothetical protein